MKAYVCKVCGYVHIGDEAPEKIGRASCRERV